MNGKQEVFREIKAVEAIDLGVVSGQMLDLMRKIEEQSLKDEDIERLTQIHPEVGDYLLRTIKEKPENIDSQELESFLLILLLTPKPTEQKELLDTYQELLEKENSQKIKKEVVQYFQIQEDLKKVGSQDRLDYFSCLTPEERKEHQEQIQEDLKKAGSQDRLNYFPRLTPEERKEHQKQIQEYLKEARPQDRLNYFPRLTPEERKEHQKQIQEDLKKVELRDRLDYFFRLTPEERKEHQKQIKKIQKDFKKAESQVRLIYFSRLTPEERKEHQEQIREDLKEVWSWYRLNYFSCLTPEERKEHQEQIQEDLKEARPQDRLIYFSCLTPEERKEHQEQIQEDLKKAGSQDRLNYFPRLTPEERKEHQEQIREDLKEAEPQDRLIYFSRLTPEERKEHQAQIQENLKEAGPWGRLIYFSRLTPEERFVSEQAKKIINRLESQLNHEIGDVGLRKGYYELLADYLRENKSLIVLDGLWRKKDKLALFLGLDSVSDFPLPALSWELSKDQKSALLYVFQRLKEQQKEPLLSGIHLPFRPRKKEVAGFEDSLVYWFRQIDFLNSLGTNLEADKVLKEHLEFIKEKQRQYKIQFDTTEIPFSFLKEIVREIKGLVQKVQEKFQKLLDLEELETEKFQNFIERWNSDVESILVLAQRLSQSYPEAKKLLKKVVLAEIEGDYFNVYYDLNDDLTRTQLLPLLKDKPQETWPQIIKTYHKGVTLLKSLEAETKPSKVLDKFFLKEEERGSIKANLHPELLFDLPEYQKLTEEERNNIIQFLPSPFLSKEGRETLSIRNIAELKSKCEGKISQEYLAFLISLYQFFNDLNSGQKTPKELLSTLDRLKDRLPQDIKETAFWRDDISQYLKAQIEEKAKEPKEKPKEERAYLLCHTTDHPKTLLEIGKYPLYSGSCQSYDYSNLGLAKSLLGYVFDTHIQAIVIRQLKTTEPISEILSLDEGKNEARVETEKGEEKVIPFSKPIARAMVFLGEKNDQPVFILQRNYSQPGAIDINAAPKLERETLEEFIKLVNEKHNLRARMARGKEGGITIAGSHNPEGHYNDLTGGQIGQKGQSYST